jgi:hypothetical protein
MLGCAKSSAGRCQAWVKTRNAPTIAHELGHNLGVLFINAML